MCIAIVSPSADARPDAATLKRAFRANDDGAGLAYVRRGRVVRVNGLMAEADFLRAVALAEENTRGPVLIHCRIRTHGAQGKGMTHPFALPGVRAALIHNGILRAPHTDPTTLPLAWNDALSDPARPELSDTALFAEMVADWTPAKFAAERARLLPMLGWSRIAVLYPDSHVLRLGSGWYEGARGVWYSNGSAEPPPMPTKAEREAARREADPRQWRSLWSTRGFDARDLAVSRTPGPGPTTRRDRRAGPVTVYRPNGAGVLVPDTCPTTGAGQSVCQWCRTPGGCDGSGLRCDLD